MCRICLLILALMALVLSALAGVPQLINYQGRLTDIDGSPVADNTYFLKFKIYASESDDDSLWSSGIQAVIVTGGLFNYQLGSIIKLPSGLFDDSARYLGVTVGADPEISPRTKLGSTAFSMQSGNADVAQSLECMGCITSTEIGANAVNSSHIQPHTITAEDIGYDEITGDNIEDMSIGLQELEPGLAPNQIIKWDGSDWQLADDQTGTGDITEVNATGGLTGGGTSGSVTLAIATNGVTTDKINDQAITSSKLGALAVHTTNLNQNCVTTDKIADGNVTTADIGTQTIIDDDISYSANIAVNKISGTAVNLSSSQTITGNKTFSGTTQFKDSTLQINDYGLRIGNNNGISIYDFVDIRRDFNTTTDNTGLGILMENANTGYLTGISSAVHCKTPSVGGLCYGANIHAYSDGAQRYGLFSLAETRTSYLTTGYSYGIRGDARYGAYTIGVYGLALNGTANYGVYGSCGSTTSNYGGYFVGNLHATGTNTKAAGGYMIDHPVDPANMYLAHSDVSSPDMMNIYNGNIELDANGEAVVKLPSYFDALNDNYRYQLTPIGASMPELYVARKIEDNSFIIAGGKPFMEVSWQVTGVRKDAFAKAKVIEVESLKTGDKQGLYQNPELFGFGIEKAIDFENHKTALENESHRHETEQR